MMDLIDENKLRFEGYFMINSVTELLDSCSDLINLFRNYDYVSCNVVTIKNTFKRLIIILALLSNSDKKFNLVLDKTCLFWLAIGT